MNTSPLTKHSRSTSSASDSIVTRAIASACHEASRALASGLCDQYEPAWNHLSGWEQQRTLNDVLYYVAHPDAPASHRHERWVQEMRAHGWKFGETKSEENKTDPLLVPFDALPGLYQLRHDVFKQVASTVGKARALSIDNLLPSPPSFERKPRVRLHPESVIPNYREIDKLRGHPYSRGRFSQLYSSWNNMLSRCYYPDHREYGNAGGCGIKVCREWRSFAPFVEWAQRTGYAAGMCLARVNLNGDYYPANCQWVSKAQICRKQRGATLTNEQVHEVKRRVREEGAHHSHLAAEFGVSVKTIARAVKCSLS